MPERWPAYGEARRLGAAAPEPLGGGGRAKLADHADRVHALLAAAPDSTIAELRSRLAAAGIAGSPAAISRFLNACGLTRKQSPRTPPSKSVHRTSPPRGTPDAQQGALSPERLVFIDNETGPPPPWRAAMAGPAAGGACRCRPRRPLEGHDFIAALRDGLTAPCVFRWRDQRRALPRLYVEQALAPALRAGDIVVVEPCGP